ncbi:hypothetical protein SCHPADRAFT_894280 [Schizopora paradoxa]|uniref:AB hydrolase-1 domain-containing protein n=1 Tax=Schizopora paradoxa TaxID=27342 RepID=A0A0H2R7Z2_9AGAM|nr:hypothetical protein SCHPADRAFT_894280 [Schizopora paradoxa]
MTGDSSSKNFEPIPSQSAGGLQVSAPLPPDLILIVFIHGFKGTDSTFLEFPERLRHIVSETVANVIVESVVFPAYETKGELNAAVERFADWLATFTVEKEVAHGTGGGAGKAKLILCGHSMGGLVAADTLIALYKSRPDDDAPLWPRIIGCIAYDTPYFGLHPFVFKNSASKAFGYMQTAHKLISTFGSNSPTTAASASKAPVAAIMPPPSPASSTSSWAKWATPAAVGLGGLLISGVTAGAAYYKRDDLGLGYKWATDHMKYVGNLWDEQQMKRRVELLFEIESKMGVVFRDFYTILPAKPPQQPEPRTFIILPKNASQRDHFVPAPNGIAEDEVEAHTGMFQGSTNDSYYTLGLETVKLVREAVMSSRDVPTIEAPAAPAPPSQHSQTTATNVEENLIDL